MVVLAVSVPLIVGETNVADELRTTSPLPVVAWRSPVVTRPVAVKPLVTVRLLIDGDEASTTVLPEPVTLARSAAVTSPVAVKLEVTVKPTMDCAALQEFELPRLSLTVTAPV